MKLTRVQAQRVIDKIDTQSDFPWKHELNYLRETVDELFDEVEKYRDKERPCGYGYISGDKDNS